MLSIFSLTTPESGLANKESTERDGCAEEREEAKEKLQLCVVCSSALTRECGGYRTRGNCPIGHESLQVMDEIAIRKQHTVLFSPAVAEVLVSFFICYSSYMFAANATRARGTRRVVCKEPS